MQGSEEQPDAAAEAAGEPRASVGVRRHHGEHARAVGLDSEREEAEERAWHREQGLEPDEVPARTRRPGSAASRAARNQRRAGGRGGWSAEGHGTGAALEHSDS